MPQTTNFERRKWALNERGARLEALPATRILQAADRALRRQPIADRRSHHVDPPRRAGNARRQAPPRHAGKPCAASPTSSTYRLLTCCVCLRR